MDNRFKNLFIDSQLSLLLSAVIGIISFSCGNMQGQTESDWLMWRYDAHHSGSGMMDLSSDLHLQWKREFHTPEPAFPDEEIRLNFDSSYEPVASGRNIYVPSMVTGSITALDTRTGRENWKFYADGPVRFAPIVWKRRVYFGSDDGYLYCLNAANGKLIWKFFAAPEEVVSYKLLGNNRLISRWAVRGGPVLKDGVIYFGSGLWPSEGVCVYAVDAKSGKLIWKNSKPAFIENGLVDHGARRNIGLCPLGYLTIAGDHLIVPMGRALPAVFDLQTGEMEPYSSGWGGRGGLGKGSWWVCGMDNYFYTNGELYGLAEHLPDTEVKEFMTVEEFAEATSLSVGNVKKLLEEGKLTFKEQNGQELIRVRIERSYLTSDKSRDFDAEEYVIKNYPRLQVSGNNKYNQCEFRKPVVTGNTVFYSVPVPHDSIGYKYPALPNGARYIVTGSDKELYNGIEAYDLGADGKWKLTATQNCPDANVILYRTLQFEKLWRLDSNLKVHIRAGNKLYGGAPGIVAAIDLENEPQMVWQERIEGTPATMLAADDRLFVVTKEGVLYCFGADRTEVSEYKISSKRVEFNDKDIQIDIEEILSLMNNRVGYCFILGLPEPNVIHKIYRETTSRVIVLEPDRQKVQKGRQYFDKLGIYGKRLQIVTGDLTSLDLPPYIANIVIAVNMDQSIPLKDLKCVNQLVSLLRPFNGIACLNLPEQQCNALENKLKQLDIEGISLENGDKFVLLKREGAPPGSAPWTHEEGSPANTASNMDVTIKPFMGVSWFGGPVDDSIFSKIKLDYTHSRPPHPLVCDGRMFFIIYDELHAVDVYTGCPLWKFSLPRSFKTKYRKQEHFTGRRNTADNYIATSDIFYLIMESSCLMLDPVTGRLMGEITIPSSLKSIDGKKLPYWHEVRIWKENLLVSIGNYLVCMDRHTGELQWQTETKKDCYSFALGNGKVYAADYWLPDRRKNITEKESKIRAFDIETGIFLWETSVRLLGQDIDNVVKYHVHPMDPYLSYSEIQDVVILSSGYNVLSAYTGAEGKELWRSDGIRIPRGFPPVVLGDKFVTRSGEVYNLLTGDIIEKQVWDNLRGCNSLIGNKESVFVRDGVPMVYRPDNGFQNLFLSSRSGCTNNLIPGDGVLTVLNFAVGCACNYPVFTSFGAAYMPEAENWK